MKVMVLVKASESSERGDLPDKELMAEMGKFNERLVEAGIMRSGDGLKPSKEGVRMQFSGSERTLVTGPFAETKELVAGFWVWEVESMEKAIEWVRQCPNPMPEDSEIEIRPMYEMEDFAELDPDGSEKQKEDGLRREIALQQGSLSNYLFFAGRCEEALEFYQAVFGARVTMKLRFSDSPDPIPEGQLAPGFEDKIMHSEFRIGNTTVLASDGCNTESEFGGFSLAIQLEDERLLREVFTELQEGGQVIMPLAKTFWSPCYGQLKDKFGVHWMLMVPGDAPTDAPTQ